MLKFAADGKDPSIGDFGIARDGRSIVNWGADTGDFKKYTSDREEAFKSYTSDVSRATIAALDNVALPKWAREQFALLGSGASIEQFSALVEAVVSFQGALRGMQEQVAPLGGVFARVAGLSGDALKQLVDFAGGIEAFGARVGAYVKDYYSEAEQAALSAATLQTQLRAAGVDSGALQSREQFRALVDATDVGSEAGRRQLSALLEVSAAFAPLSDYLTRTGATLADLAALAPSIASLGSLDAEAQMATVAGLVAIDGSVLSIGTQISEAVQALQSSTEAGLTAIAAASQATLRQLQGWDGGGVLLTAVEAP